MSPPDESQFASFTWQQRWNDSTQTAAISQSGSRLMFVNCMGSVEIDMDDAPCLVRQLRASADALDRTVQQHHQALLQANLRSILRKLAASWWSAGDTVDERQPPYGEAEAEADILALLSSVE